MSGLAHCLAMVEIREATSDDVPDLLRLYTDAGIVSEHAFDVAQARAQLEKFKQYPYYRVFVATLGTRIVGTYEFMLMDNLAKAGAATAIVEDVAVAPDVHKQGIGRAMMQHARHLARQHGAYKLMLSSNLRREDAHRFYDALGFTRHGYSFLVAP